MQTDFSPQDDTLWQVARQRAAFKRSVVSYIVVNAFLVGIWFFSSAHYNYFWPKWPMLGWGIGLVFQYLGAYQGNNFFSAQKEYDKLKNNQA